MQDKTPTAPDALAFMRQRRSYPRLQEPAPTGDVLESIFAAALCAPDHMRLRPWRFLTIEGDQRDSLGGLFAAHEHAKDSCASELILQQAHQKALRAPLIIVGIAAYRKHPKVPPIEQALAAGGVLNNMGLAAYCSGFGAVWRTGSYAYSKIVKAGLRVASHEDIIGYLYVGTPPTWDRQASAIEVDDYVHAWPQ